MQRGRTKTWNEGDQGEADRNPEGQKEGSGDRSQAQTGAQKCQRQKQKSSRGRAENWGPREQGRPPFSRGEQFCGLHGMPLP